MIEWLWELLQELREYLGANFDPIRDTIDILIVAFAIYWLLLLIRGTRAVQIVVGLIVLFAANLVSMVFQLVTVRLILDSFIPYAVLIIVILFQNDIRRALARVGRGFFRSASAAQESEIVEKIVRAAQILSQRRLGALMVLERETGLDDQIEAGTVIDSEVSKELLVALFQPTSPLHDGAVVIQEGRVAQAGAILPLTLTSDLPEGVGTRHRAAVGITEETDALVVVVSQETATISVVLGGEMVQNLDAPRLRVVLTDILSSDRGELPASAAGPIEAEGRAALATSEGADAIQARFTG